jgi:predicted dienelactone hydrolase
VRWVSVTGRGVRSLGVGGLWLVALAGFAAAAVAGPAPARRCAVASGRAARSCAKRYAAALRACRDDASSDCEAALREEGGRLAALLAKTEGPVRRACTEASAGELNFGLGLEDLVTRTAEACEKWGEEVVAISHAPAEKARAVGASACQQTVGAEVARFHHAAVGLYGRCQVAILGGEACDRSRRDERLARAKADAVKRIEHHCGADFDALGLVSPDSSPTLTGRIETLADVALGRARHLAERVYPAFPLGPLGLFGPAPVGVRTFELFDATRLNVAGNGPRPLLTELYYPSTAAGVTGVPRDVVRVLNTDLFATPTYRDVPLAPGTFPLVIVSPGGGLSHWLYVYLAAHLASHGFLVATIDHDGDRFGLSGDLARNTNRPLDLSELLDQLLSPGDGPASFLAGVIDPERIGAVGHSLGGYAVSALAICPLPDAFSDARVKALLTLESAIQAFGTQAPGVFSTVAIPTLLMTGTTPLAFLNQTAFDALTPGPSVHAFAELSDAFHLTFSDFCEVPAEILVGLQPVGPKPECEPEGLPWRHARYLTNYLALSFFDAALNGNAEALARLGAAELAEVEELVYQRKAEDCPSQSCEISCVLPCGDGTLAPSEACDAPGEQGTCDDGLCNENCSECVTCDDATPIPPEGGVLTGTTVGAPAVIGSSCGGDIFGPERVFSWTPGTSHTATIRTTGGTTNFDTTLYVREGGCIGPDLACNDDADQGILQSSVTLPVVAGTPYFIIVDGFGIESGAFTLSVDVAN